MKLLLVERSLGCAEEQFGFAAAMAKLMGITGLDEPSWDEACPHNSRAGRSAAATGHDLPCIAMEVRMDMESLSRCCVDANGATIT